jgi:hypothetical protein
MPSVWLSFDLSREFRPEGTSKDSRKLFNPRLFSQTRTDVSVQFSRSRRRPAARRRILAERFIGVKRKRSGSSCFSALFRFSRFSQPKNSPRIRRAGVLNIGHEPPPVKGIAQEPGQRMHRGSRRRAAPVRTGRIGEVRATPLPRSNRAPCAKERILMPSSEALPGGAPNRRNLSHRILETAQR